VPWFEVEELGEGSEARWFTVDELRALPDPPRDAEELLSSASDW
jgi:hypothetical protein